MVVASGIIAATAAVVGAGAAVVGAVQSGNAQKKAANQAAATEEENARRAEENAQAWAEANEQQTAFNHAEATLDADIVKGKTARDIAFLSGQRGYQSTVYDRSIASTTAQMQEQGDAITRKIGAQSAQLSLKLGAANRQIDTQNALLSVKEGRINDQIATQSALVALRGDSISRDAEDEIAALMGQSSYQRAALGRKASETLSAATAAVLAADTRTGFETANLEASAADLDTAAKASLRRAGVEKALGAAEQLRLRAQGERIVGAARAQAGKAGVALSGSSLDVMAEQAGETELAALAAKYQADITVDSYVEDARAKGVRAVQLRGQAGQTQILGALDAVNTMAEAEYNAAELHGQASEIARKTGESVGTLERKRQADLAALALEGRDSMGALDANARSLAIEGEDSLSALDANLRSLAIEGRLSLDDLKSNLGALWREGGDRVAALGAERANTLGNFDDQIATARLQGEQQEAALRREAEQIKKKGEIDARNIRLTQLAQAADFRASAAARRESGSAAQTAGYLSAGATILGTASKLATQWPTLGGSAAAGSTAYDAAPAAVTDIA
ncbi:hypothetical protein [Azospirillum sp.]|uniref:hypothetical protein n=1 Tax=Azospirillum sp. TaxID=34012 RepID=UPI00263858AD|nr:hypothetical protein [Azospirillum sp.]